MSNSECSSSKFICYTRVKIIPINVTKSSGQRDKLEVDQILCAKKNREKFIVDDVLPLSI